MANKRVYYAVYAVGIAPDGSDTYTEVHGLQSVGMTTTFNLEQVFEIGQVAIYENIENIPDIECTLERVIDGYPLAWHLATRDATSTSLAGRSNAKCAVALSVFDDTQDSASGVPLRQVVMSGMYPSAITYTMPVDGNCTESLTLVGNNKVWKSSTFTFSGNLFDNTDEPLALTSGTGGVQRRENVKFDGVNYTKLPGGTNGIPGISSSGTNDRDSNGQFGANIQNISVSTSLGRTNINELGRRNPYFRYVEFPVEVTTEIEVLDLQGDGVSATEEGILGDGNNLSNNHIRIKLEEGTVIDVGTTNKLSSVSSTGGDATGGNRSNTYTYTNFNIFTVTHPQDPT